MSITTCMPIDGNIASLGNCFWFGGFGGDTIIIGLIILLGFAIVLWKSRIPMLASVCLGWILMGGLVSAGLGGQPLYVAWMLGLPLFGFLIARGVMNFAKSQQV